MVLIQSDSECRIFNEGDIFIAVSDNSVLTPDQARLKLLERTLLGLSNGEITKASAVKAIKDIANGFIHVVTANSSAEAYLKIASIIASYGSNA